MLLLTRIHKCQHRWDFLHNIDVVSCVLRQWFPVVTNLRKAEQTCDQPPTSRKIRWPQLVLCYSIREWTIEVGEYPICNVFYLFSRCCLTWQRSCVKNNAAYSIWPIRLWSTHRVYYSVVNVTSTSFLMIPR